MSSVSGTQSPFLPTEESVPPPVPLAKTPPKGSGSRASSGPPRAPGHGASLTAVLCSGPRVEGPVRRGSVTDGAPCHWSRREPRALRRVPTRGPFVRAWLPALTLPRPAKGRAPFVGTFAPVLTYPHPAKGRREVPRRTSPPSPPAAQGCHPPEQGCHPPAQTQSPGVCASCASSRGGADLGEGGVVPAPRPPEGRGSRRAGQGLCFPRRAGARVLRRGGAKAGSTPAVKPLCLFRGPPAPCVWYVYVWGVCAWYVCVYVCGVYMYSVCMVRVCMCVVCVCV